MAGDQFTHSFANAEAAEHYTHAINAATKLPLVSAGSVGDLHAKCGAVLSIIGRHPQALDEYARAVDCACSANYRPRENGLLVGTNSGQVNAHPIAAMRD